MLIGEIEEVLKRKQIAARVQFKENAKGETVIGVIIDRHQPTLDALATNAPSKPRQ
jgi:hypothetical protein